MAEKTADPEDAKEGPEKGKPDAEDRAEGPEPKKKAPTTSGPHGKLLFGKPFPGKKKG